MYAFVLVSGNSWLVLGRSGGLVMASPRKEPLLICGSAKATIPDICYEFC